MAGRHVGTRQYRRLIVVLAMVWIGSALTIASCGTDGASGGGLCGGCGDSDGACQPTFDFPAGTAGEQEVCTGGTGPCTVALLCRRKLDDAQRRCFPATEADGSEPAAFFECDGSRPNAEVRICGNGTVESGEQCDDGNTTSGDGCEADCTLPVATATPAATPTGPTPTPAGPTPSPTGTAVAGASCGNGVVDEIDEECDGADVDFQTCDDLCEPADEFGDVTGLLSCFADCRLNFTGCMNAVDCSF